MVLLKNGFDLHAATSGFVQEANNLFIYVPYIKANSLSTLLREATSCKAIFVRWEIKDLVSGASDLEIYPYCVERKISLFRNPRLHLKAYVEDYKKCLLTTANISNRALTANLSATFNFELGAIIENLTVEDRLYFAMIGQSSTLITPEIFAEIQDKIANAAGYLDEDPDDFLMPDKQYNISSLPLSDIEELDSFYFTKEADNEIIKNCAIHDLALYQIPFGLTRPELYQRLSTAFFSHPFIKDFGTKLHERGEVYFGEAKAWIQENCSDVPIPRKWEITENIQILYRWFATLGNLQYGIDRPNYSERLYRL